MICQLEGLCSQFPVQCTLTLIGACFKISLGILKLLLCIALNIVAIGVHLELAV